MKFYLVLVLLAVIIPVSSFALTMTIDFDTATEDELRMIDTIIHQRLGTTSTPTPPPALIAMPSIIGMTKDDAVQKLESMGLVCSVVELETDEWDTGIVLSQSIEKNTKCNAGQKVEITVATGISDCIATHHTYHWYNIKGSSKDKIEGNYFLPSIDGHEKKLYIPMKVTLYPQYDAEWTNIGYAEIRDEYDKRVPIAIDYMGDAKIVKGDPKDIVLIVPLQDLQVDKPTTLTTVVTLEYTKTRKQFEWKVDHSIAW